MMDQPARRIRFPEIFKTIFRMKQVNLGGDGGEGWGLMKTCQCDPKWMGFPLARQNYPIFHF